MSKRSTRVAFALAWAALAAAVFLWLAPDFDYFARGGSGVVDHGYQTALGQQAYLGAKPGIDFFTQYGPAISWVAALSWSTGHVWLAEVLSWCIFLAMGYGLLWWWVGNETNLGRKVFVLLPAFLFTPYYAKYYFVFFPALFLVLLGDGPRQDDGSGRAWRWFFAGVVAGIAGLFRLELGLALTLAGVVYLGWDDAVARRLPRGALLVVVGATAVGTGYGFYLAACAHSWAAPFRFLDFAWAAILGKISAFSRNEVSMHGPLQRNAAGFWSLAGLAVLYGGVGLAGIRSAWRAKYPRRIWAAAVLGCALLPQIMHNTGVTYALQAGLPAYAVISAWCLENWAAARRRALGVLAAAVVLGFGLRLGHPNYGYVGLTDDFCGKLNSLAHETIRVQPPEGTPSLTATIQGLAGPGQPILIPDVDIRFYALARRPWAGLVPHLAIPLPVRWQQRCVEELRRRPPAVVILSDPEKSAASRFSFLGRNPLIEAFISENYLKVDQNVPGWIFLVPRGPR